MPHTMIMGEGECSEIADYLLNAIIQIIAIHENLFNFILALLISLRFLGIFLEFISIFLVSDDKDN